MAGPPLGAWRPTAVVLRAMDLATSHGRPSVSPQQRRKNHKGEIAMRRVSRVSTGIVLLVFAVGLTELPAGESKAKISIDDLTVEYRTNPLGIDTPVPRFSWRIQSEIRRQKQTAYHVFVASARRNSQTTGATFGTAARSHPVSRSWFLITVDLSRPAPIATGKCEPGIAMENRPNGASPPGSRSGR